MILTWKQLQIHFVLIVLFLSIPVFSSPDFDLNFTVFNEPPFLKNFIGYIIIVFFFYINYYFLIPRILDFEKYFFYVILVILYFLILICILYFIFDFENNNNNNMKFVPPDSNHPQKKPLSIILNLGLLAPYLLILLLSYVIHLYTITKKVELEKSKMELENLKYQLQPHFLFNSLNNIYSVSVFTPEKTQNYILELAEILRYFMNTDNSTEILIEKELKFCVQYVDLQRLRFGKVSDLWKININHETDCKIAPLLLIPIIENIFKYGINPDKESPIEINIIENKGVLSVYCYNLKNTKANEQLLSSQKIGIEKTKQRFQLLYPGKHLLTIDENDTSYALNLRIELNEGKKN